MTKLFTKQPNMNVRLHRFPPLASNFSLTNDDEIVHDLQYAQHQIQEELEKGFQQGLSQGHEEGVKNGFNQGIQQGVLEGQKKGFEKGYCDGQQAGRKDFDALAAPIQAIFEHVSAWQKQQEKEQRELICELVKHVAQRVIRAELTLMPQQILTLVNETLSNLPCKSEDVTIHLNPQDHERFKQINADIPASWKIVSDKDLPVGGCKLVTEHAEADAGCDGRLEACVKQLESHLLDSNQELITSADWMKIESDEHQRDVEKSQQQEEQEQSNLD